MKRLITSDYFGLAMCIGFGLWWSFFPKSVIRFYTWFHRQSVRMPRASVIRILGILWIALVLMGTAINLR